MLRRGGLVVPIITTTDRDVGRDVGMERALVACLQLAVALAVLGALALARFIYQVVESRGQLEWDQFWHATRHGTGRPRWHNAMAFAADKRDLHAWLNGHCPSNRGGFYSVWRPELYQNVRAGDVIFLPAITSNGGPRLFCRRLVPTRNSCS